MKKKSLTELIQLITPTSKQQMCLQILEDFSPNIHSIPGSKIKHQAWEGGYLDHIIEGMNIIDVLYDLYSRLRGLPFTKSEALFVFFLHDFDKVLRFSNPSTDKGYSEDYLEKVIKLLKDNYNYTLNDGEYNGIKYAHGEGHDYSPTERIMQPLATLIHIADVTSARIWFDFGKDKENW